MFCAVIELVACLEAVKVAYVSGDEKMHHKRADNVCQTLALQADINIYDCCVFVEYCILNAKLLQFRTILYIVVYLFKYMYFISVSVVWYLKYVKIVFCVTVTEIQHSHEMLLLNFEKKLALREVKQTTQKTEFHWRQRHYILFIWILRCTDSRNEPVVARNRLKKVFPQTFS